MIWLNRTTLLECAGPLGSFAQPALHLRRTDGLEDCCPAQSGPGPTPGLRTGRSARRPTRSPTSGRPPPPFPAPRERRTNPAGRGHPACRARRAPRSRLSTSRWRTRSHSAGSQIGPSRREPREELRGKVPRGLDVPAQPLCAKDAVKHRQLLPRSSRNGVLAPAAQLADRSPVRPREVAPPLALVGRQRLPAREDVASHASGITVASCWDRTLASSRSWSISSWMRSAWAAHAGLLCSARRTSGACRTRRAACRSTSMCAAACPSASEPAASHRRRRPSDAVRAPPGPPPSCPRRLCRRWAGSSGAYCPSTHGREVRRRPRPGSELRARSPGPARTLRDAKTPLRRPPGAAIDLDRARTLGLDRALGQCQLADQRVGREPALAHRLVDGPGVVVQPPPPLLQQGLVPGGVVQPRLAQRHRPLQLFEHSALVGPYGCAARDRRRPRARRPADASPP